MQDVKILISSEIEEIIFKEIEKCTEDINIISAFCKLNTLILLDENIANRNIQKRLLVRFLPSDIYSSVTDKEIYEYCKNNGWKLYFDFSMHAKTYIFDKIKCVIGSPNLTNKGIGIAKNSNKEIANYFELSHEKYTKVLTLYENAMLMTDDVYKNIIESENSEDVSKYEKAIKLPDINCLMQEDFPSDMTDLAELYTLKSYKWLILFLKSKENHKAFFGELTAEIHNLFIKDPRPFRKDVKNHLQDLFNSIKTLKPKSLEVDRPNFSECVRLIEKYETNRN